MSSGPMEDVHGSLTGEVTAAAPGVAPQACDRCNGTGGILLRSADIPTLVPCGACLAIKATGSPA